MGLHLIKDENNTKTFYNDYKEKKYSFTLSEDNTYLSIVIQDQDKIYNFRLDKENTSDDPLFRVLDFLIDDVYKRLTQTDYLLVSDTLHYFCQAVDESAEKGGSIRDAWNTKG